MKKFVLTNCEGTYGIERSAEMLRQGDSTLDALEQGIKLVESDVRAHTVGFGGKPNMLGIMECDASIMDGSTLQTGSVGAVKNTLHVISLARQVMEKLPHVILTGDGAERFARECGLSSTQMLAPGIEDQYYNWLKDTCSSDTLDAGTALSDFCWKTASPRTAKGTTVFLAGDGQQLAGAASTSGWGYKYPGRLGDSPIIGAGLYTDSRYGGCACTHTGEMTIRAATAVSVIRYMKKGASVKEACHEAFDDLRDLKGGYLGAVVIHAVNAAGEPYVLTTGNDDDVLYWFWQEGMAKSISARPHIEAL